MQGRIIKNISNDYTVEVNKKNYICKPRGKFRNEKSTPLVGDIVNFDENNHYILDILPRKNYLIRPSIANIDIAVIVTSVKNPNLDTYLLDKTMTIISYNNITPIIYFSKIDLLDEQELKEINKIIAYYKNIGYDVTTNEKELLPLLKNKIVVFTGQSGAGKSTLLNKLDSNLKLLTNEISYSLGRGKHTTRHTQLYHIKDTLIADTPGFSKVDFNGMNKFDIRDNMNEMFDNLKYCKYDDCLHLMEDGCQVKKLLNEGSILKSRYDNYQRFMKE